MSSELNKWFYQPSPAPEAKQRLFCFHFAGGSAQIFRKWGVALEKHAEVQAVQLPGRANRFGEKPFTRVEEIVSGLLPALAMLLDKPFAFFGHSLGAIIAFELSRKLKAENLKLPSGLYLASRVAPEIKPPAKIATLPDDDFLNALTARYGNAPGSALMNDPELRAMYLPSLRADMQVFESYEYHGQEHFDFPIATLRGKADIAISAEAMDGWKKIAPDRYEYHEFSGGHFFWQDDDTELLSFLKSSLSSGFGPK